MTKRVLHYYDRLCASSVLYAVRKYHPHGTDYASAAWRLSRPQRPQLADLMEAWRDDSPVAFLLGEVLPTDGVRSIRSCQRYGRRTASAHIYERARLLRGDKMPAVYLRMYAGEPGETRTVDVVMHECIGPRDLDDPEILFGWYRNSEKGEIVVGERRSTFHRLILTFGPWLENPPVTPYPLVFA